MAPVLHHPLLKAFLDAQVIVPSFTYVASAAAVVSVGGVPVFVDCDPAVAVVSVGGVPVFVDCDPELGLMDAEMVRRAVSTKTKFIMAVHIYGAVSTKTKFIMAVHIDGHVPDMDTINAIAKAPPLCPNFVFRTGHKGDSAPGAGSPRESNGSSSCAEMTAVITSSRRQDDENSHDISPLGDIKE
ncbi:hypothetical protein T484DRAFT_1779045 [Baffinella frigidus]|nr:hypothetical protein T484DRAFT_1779045 [Cryptophyta sp. CCMP2293]